MNNIFVWFLIAEICKLVLSHSRHVRYDVMLFSYKNKIFICKCAPFIRSTRSKRLRHFTVFYASTIEVYTVADRNGLLPSKLIGSKTKSLCFSLRR